MKATASCSSLRPRARTVRATRDSSTRGKRSGGGGEAVGGGGGGETRGGGGVPGAEGVEFLGYVDSGMMGTPENDKAGSFWGCDVEEAAGRLGATLRGEAADGPRGRRGH